MDRRKDSMKSTWRTNRDQWTLSHWMFEWSNSYPISLDQPVPVHAAQDPVPCIPNWRIVCCSLASSSIPLAIHQAYATCTGHNVSTAMAFVYYAFAFTAVATRITHVLRGLAHDHGFLDGEHHDRDGVPDIAVHHVLSSILLTTTLRTLVSILLTYEPGQAPLSSPSWLLWLLPELSLYGIVLDFWFYWYHRALHEIPFLWRFHRTHHLSKHPNPLLSIFADPLQEFFDMVGIPLLAYYSMRFIGFPMGFYDWWYCHQLVVIAEMGGHSGVRIYMSAPSPINWLLRRFDVDIICEDHDLHHRMGWRKSYNYGKQSRLWDRIFGTMHERIEVTKQNLSPSIPVNFPFI